MKIRGLKRSIFVSAWFMFLTFPVMVIRVNTVENIVQWRWMNMIYVGIGSFILSFIWRYLIGKKGIQADIAAGLRRSLLVFKVRSNPVYYVVLTVACLVVAIVFPFFFSTYQVSIISTALMYIVLGLGLNIVVGLAGLLDLGYVAFYAVGAYTYALLNVHFGVGFWLALPAGALVAALFGILLGFPVLRLRGDYLAIVTLGFGEIIRLVLENWNDFSFGPSGISNISRPGFFNMDLGLKGATIYLYYLLILLTIFTVFVVGRITKSRIGRAWVALREDEIACQSMGIDKTKIKLSAFAMGATWAGLVGCIFAAKTTFINPASFTFMESVMILSIVVIGGMGSIPGVIIGALILILLPEYLRIFSENRMLVFGAIMVIMMIFRPQGMIGKPRRKYEYHTSERPE